MAGPTDITRRARARARPLLLALLRVAKTMPCPRCGRPMTIGQALDVGHTVDVVDGGANSPMRLEHRACNRKAGDRRRARGKRSQRLSKLIKRAAVSQRAKRDAERMDKIAKSDDRRRARMILPTNTGRR